MATASWPARLAAATTSVIRLAPSRRLYSVWVWRWTKSLKRARGTGEELARPVHFRPPRRGSARLRGGSWCLVYAEALRERGGVAATKGRPDVGLRARGPGLPGE